MTCIRFAMIFIIGIRFRDMIHKSVAIVNCCPVYGLPPESGLSPFRIVVSDLKGFPFPGVAPAGLGDFV